MPCGTYSEQLALAQPLAIGTDNQPGVFYFTFFFDTRPAPVGLAQAMCKASVTSHRSPSPPGGPAADGGQPAGLARSSKAARPRTRSTEPNGQRWWCPAYISLESSPACPSQPHGVRYIVLGGTYCMCGGGVSSMCMPCARAAGAKSFLLLVERFFGVLWGCGLACVTFWCVRGGGLSFAPSAIHMPAAGSSAGGALAWPPPQARLGDPIDTHTRCPTNGASPKRSGQASSCSWRVRASAQ
jgi:hypothetical protein